MGIGRRFYIGPSCRLQGRGAILNPTSQRAIAAGVPERNKRREHFIHSQQPKERIMSFTDQDKHVLSRHRHSLFYCDRWNVSCAGTATANYARTNRGGPYILK